ncbi:MAG: hypothetical protein AB7U75_14025 [Hyphomicrobiaceae bacterium]
MLNRRHLLRLGAAVPGALVAPSVALASNGEDEHIVLSANPEHPGYNRPDCRRVDAILLDGEELKEWVVSLDTHAGYADLTFSTDADAIEALARYKDKNAMGWTVDPHGPYWPLVRVYGKVSVRWVEDAAINT